MNEPIISPWIFYLADILQGLGALGVILLIVSIMGSIGLWASYYIRLDEIENLPSRDYTVHSVWTDLVMKNDVSPRALEAALSKLGKGATSLFEIQKWARISTAILLLSVFIILFVPSKDTFYKMIAAHYITPNTVNKVLDTGKSLHDVLKKDILDLIDHIKAGGKDDSEGKGSKGN